jgi:hypothetical protein
MSAGIVILRTDPDLFDKPGKTGSLLSGVQIPSLRLLSGPGYRCKIILISGFGEKVA